MDLAIFQSKLAKTLSPARYRHSIEVMHLACKLAGIYGVEPDLAVIAGLLHDVAREIAPRDLLTMAETMGLNIDEVERKAPVLLHGKVGAELLRREWGQDNPAVLQAVAQHITGAPVMPLISQIVFIADFAEPGRQYGPAHIARRLAMNNRVTALKYIFHQEIQFVLEREFLIHPLTVQAWNHLLTAGDILLKEKEELMDE